MTQDSSRGASRREAEGDRARTAGWLLLVLAIPRIVRLAWPEVWVEDDFYLETAYLVSAGMRPYVDFVHPHMPLLEWIAAGYLRLFGANHRSLEILNESMIYLTSVLVWALGRRAVSKPAAVMGAILYAFSSLVFRYHVYERECFVAPAALIGTIAALDRNLSAPAQCARISLAFIIACAVKLTAGIPCAVVLIFLAVVERRLFRALIAGAAIAAGLTLLSLVCYRLYGFEFVFQTFLFHFLKGRDAAGGVAAYPVQILDVLAPLSVLGCAAIAAAHRMLSRGLGLVLAMAAAEYAFFGLLSPTAWGHNYLEALPYIAIAAGLGLDYLIEAFGSTYAADARQGTRWLRLGASAPAIVISLGWITPIVNQNWLHGSVYGFGFVARDELRQVAAALRATSAPGEAVIAPSFVCFEANRRELIRYPETYGVYREALDEYRRDGFRAARDHLGGADFFELINATAHFWVDPMRQAIRDGRVKVVIADSPIQLLPLVMLQPEFLLQSGFKPAMRTDHFTLWLRENAPPPGPAP